MAADPVPAPGPSVTILINNYNYADYLGEAIESALGQSWPSVAVIVVDDGSTDHSVEIARRYLGRPGFRLIEQANGGQNAAVRHGLAHVESDYLIILDSDDALEPDACAVLAPLMAEGYDLIQYRLRKVDDAGETLGYWPIEPFLHDGHTAYYRRHGYIPSAPTSGNMVRTAFAKRAFAHVVGDRSAPDGHLIFSAAMLGRVTFHDEALGRYRVHGGNRSTAATRKMSTIASQVRINLNHASGVRAFVEASGAGTLKPHLVSTYTWRDMMLVSLYEPRRFAEFPIASIAANGVRAFAAARHLGVARRGKNIAFLALGAIAAGTRRLVGHRRG